MSGRTLECRQFGMSTQNPGNPQSDPAAGAEREAAIAFARAMSLYHRGELAQAIELLDQIIAAATDEDTLKDGVAQVAAHISLYKIHRTLGHDREAGEHFSKAVSLGASAQRLKES